MKNIKYGAYAPLVDYRLARQAAIAAEQAGFDFLCFGDSINMWFPRGLWTTDFSPLAALADVDQVMDPWLMMADCATHTNKIVMGPSVCDAIRRNPTNYAQMLLTLDHMSQGRCFLGLATGEIRHFTAYGIARDKPLTRLEESVKIIKLLRDNNDPVSYDGPLWKLDRAILAIPPYNSASPPPIFVAGGAPRALRIAGEHADGWIGLAPIGGDVDELASCVRTIKQHATAAKRDPTQLTFMLQVMCLIAENEDEVEKMTHSPLLRWDSTALMIHGDDFEKWGFGPHPIKPDYNYSRDFTSMHWSTDDAWKVIDRTPPAIVRKTKIAGTPKEVARQVQPFIEAGMNWVNLCNWAMFVRDPAAGGDLVGETCNELRRLNGQPTQ
ncbi:MAG: LLM class flavin-dependent oxidoreductase [Steroidobacteraceae bacterium]